jgi:hypothetical protein
MEEPAEAVVVQRRRSPAEIKQLVSEYQASGLSRVEFCRQKGLSLATLARYRKGQALDDGLPGGRWLTVEVSGGGAELERATSSRLAVVLAGGRRIEIGRGFDARTLTQLLSVLERI